MQENNNGSSFTISPASGTKPKAKHSFKSNKILTYGACAALSVLFIAVIVWGVLYFINKPTYGDDFFVSNDVKTTISLTPTDSETSSIHQTHVVYDYDGEDVVGMKTYFEYQDAESAATAYESLKNLAEFQGAELKDNFIIVTADESQYKGLTASDVRQQAEAIRTFQMQQSGESQSESTQPDESQPEETQSEEVTDEESENE